MLATLAVCLACLSAQSSVAAGKDAMVVTAEPNATDVGVEILHKGGNAFDAAVAVGFALAVTYPQAGNIGGGGFFVGLTQHGTPMALDFLETAPAAAKRDMFLDADGNLIAGESTHSYRAVGIPGTVDGLLELQKKFGKMKLEEDLAPAIRLAEFGFPVSQAFHDSLAGEQQRLSSSGTAQDLFYPDGQPLAVGSTFAQPDLAKTLKGIAANGRAGFYEGNNARLIAQEMETQGGLITERDLKNYHCKWREPFVFNVGDANVISAPLPSAGGVMIDEIAGLANLSALKSEGRQSAAFVHDVVEGERLAFSDRTNYLGDPAFAHVSLDDLLSRSSLEKRRKLIPARKAGVSAGGPGGAEHRETTHFCVVDKAGNVAAITYTVGDSYGLGALVPGTGFLLNNEMDDFNAKPGVFNSEHLTSGTFGSGLAQAAPNEVQAGKRPLSSMTPLIVRKGDSFWFTVGTPGGATIVSTDFELLLDVSLFGMSLPEAMDAGRFHHQWLPDEIDYEEGAFGAEVVAQLTGMGYTLKQVGSIGNAAAIIRLPDGSLQGCADKRGAGKASGF